MAVAVGLGILLLLRRGIEVL